MSLSAANIVAIVDKDVAKYNALAGTSASGLGAGDGTFGYSLKCSDMTGIVVGFADATIEAVLTPIAQNWPSVEEVGPVFGDRQSAWFSALDRLARLSSGLSVTISTMDTLMSWLNFRNGVTYWQCLAHMDWVHAFTAVHGVGPDHHNSYFECLQGGAYGGTTFTNALAKLSKVAGTPTTTLGYVIDHTVYSGGALYANVISMTGSDVLTVTGWDQDGNSEAWTVTITAPGRVLLVPSTHAYSLGTKVLTLATGATNTDCVLYIEANRPAGRTNPPT